MRSDLLITGFDIEKMRNGRAVGVELLGPSQDPGLGTKHEAKLLKPSIEPYNCQFS